MTVKTLTLAGVISETMQLTKPTILTLLLFCWALSSFSQTKSDAKQPNIVFFFVDDMGWQDTSVPFHTEVTQLNKDYHTPNMERLASEGKKFTQAYAYAVCSPSRVSWMTGMNGARHRVTNWTLRKNQSPDPESESISPPIWNMNGMSQTPGEERAVYHVTLPQKLKEAGYETIHVGKAHFGAQGTSGENPLNLGFDINIGGHAAGGPGSYLGKYNFSADWRDKDNHTWDVPGLEKYHGQDVFLTEALTIEANKAIENAVNKGKPFYLYMSHYAIHAPWEKDMRFYQKYIDQGMGEFKATFASMIEGMDKSLGDIWAQLEKLGVEENTILVFMSDNGSPKQTPRNLPLRGHKLTPYEGGIRVPLIVKWPGVVEEGSQTADKVMIEDIFPTFLEVAGVAHPEKDSDDGQSFVPVLEGKKAPAKRSFYWHFPHTYDQYPYSIVRNGDWKLIYLHEDQKLELYNIAEDISETQDLILEQPKIAKKLAKALTSFLKESQAQMPTLPATGLAIPYPDELID